MDRSDEYDLYEEHADEAAFLWKLRSGAVSDPLYDLDDLCALDERIEAHIDGLRLAGPEGLEAAEELVDEGESGAEFVAMCVALHNRDMQIVARLIDLAAAQPELAAGFVSALGWAKQATVLPVLKGLVFPKLSPALHYLGVAGHAITRRDPGETLALALHSDDLRLRRRGLRAVGECQRRDLLAELLRELDGEDPGCRFQAAWSGALLGDATAVSFLWKVAAEGGSHAAEACALAARCTDLARANERLATLETDAVETKLAGVAALGDPANLPWVLRLLDDPDWARQAGEVVATITGVDLDDAKLEAPAPDGHVSGPNDDPDDEDVEMDPHDSLPWPEPTLVRAWWAKHQGGFQPGVRYVAGKRPDEGWLDELLRRGGQRLRGAAALELVIRRPNTPLFEVRAPGFVQRTLLR